MSLVANYTDSEEEAEDKEEDKGQTSDQAEVNSKTTSQSTSISKPLKNPFGVDDNNDEDDDNSSDSSSEDDKTNIMPAKKIVGDGIPLDNPFRFFGSGSIAAEDSVFRVEFREQEAKKTAVLERHVKMSQVTPAATMINGKKICFNNRKGRCRFGHKCKFLHDTDTAVIDPDSVVIKLPDKNFQPVQTSTQGTESQSQIPPQQGRKNPFCMDNVNWDSPTPIVLSSFPQLSGGEGQQLLQQQDGGGGSGSGFRQLRESSSIKEDADDEGGEEEGYTSYNKPKKKRPGLVSGLNPSLKVMKMYYNNKEKDKS